MPDAPAIPTLDLAASPDAGSFDQLCAQARGAHALRGSIAKYLKQSPAVSAAWMDVFVVVSDGPPMAIGADAPRPAGAGGAMGPASAAMQQQRRPRSLTCPRCESSEVEADPRGCGVGVLGGVVRPARGDRFVVPGRCVGRDDQAEVVLMVSSDAESCGGHWSMGVSL
jgi:hypothetical protein